MERQRGQPSARSRGKRRCVPRALQTRSDRMSMVVSEFNAVMNVITDRLNPLPTASDPAKHRPRLIRELLCVAIPATRRYGSASSGRSPRATVGMIIDSSGNPLCEIRKSLTSSIIPGGATRRVRTLPNTPGNPGFDMGEKRTPWSDNKSCCHEGWTLSRGVSGLPRSS